MGPKRDWSAANLKRQPPNRLSRDDGEVTVSLSREEAEALLAFAPEHGPLLAACDKLRAAVGANETNSKNRKPVTFMGAGGASVGIELRDGARYELRGDRIYNEFGTYLGRFLAALSQAALVEGTNSGSNR